MESAEPAYRETLRDYGRKIVADRHARLEALIGDTPFLAGERPTLADAVLVGVARWADFHEAVDVAAYPKLAALRRRIEADPAVRFALAIENGETPKGSGAMRGHVPLDEVIARFAAKAA
jgi:glutathione S-transferase